MAHNLILFKISMISQLLGDVFHKHYHSIGTDNFHRMVYVPLDKDMYVYDFF